MSYGSWARTRNGEWGVQVNGAQTGANVEVRRKDGTVSVVELGAEIETTNYGTVYAVAKRGGQSQSSGSNNKATYTKYEGAWAVLAPHGLANTNIRVFLKSGATKSVDVREKLGEKYGKSVYRVPDRREGDGRGRCWECGCPMDSELAARGEECGLC